MDREPCPDRIIDDIGSSFAIGATVGSLFHFVTGVKSSPMGERFAGGLQAARMNAPKMAGRFGVWGGLFSATDCALVYLRKKEDPWNSIFAGASTAGFLSIRGGLVPASRSALGVAAFFALCDGVMIIMEKSGAPRVVIEDPNQMPPEVAGLPDGMIRSGQLTPVNETPISKSELSKREESVFGRWREKLGLKKEEKSGDGEPKILESFDDSPTPMPTFEFK